MIKHYLLSSLFLVVAAIVPGCRKYDTSTPAKGDSTVVVPPPLANVSTAAIISAKIELKNNLGKTTEDITCSINAKDEIVAVLPNVDDSKRLVLTFATQTANVTVKNKDTLVVSGKTVTNYSKPVNLVTLATDGSTKTYKVMVKIFTGLPILKLTTSGPIVSKDDYVKGTLTVDPNMEFDQPITTIPLQAKGRGNSTWVMYPKKPYRLKFDNKAAMLGMPSAKNWVLLANYNDKTLMRNRLALALGRRLGADFTSDSRFVELYLNGDYVGNYLLTAQVEVNEARVNIKELKPTNTSDEDITGGYLLELDQKMDEVHWFKTKKDLPFSIKSPDDITPLQLKYITGYMQVTEDALFAANANDSVNGYAKYINVDSFLKWYFVEEIFQTTDARDFSSIFYYKDRNGKLGMGPIWDFDTSAGNVDYAATKDPASFWYIKYGKWFERLSKDPAFAAKVKQRWAQIKDNEVKQLLADIDENAEYLKYSQKRNFVRWPILGTYVYPNAVVTGSYDKEVEYLKSFLTKRINWMNSNMASW
ncbi:CotH kinase family protein [Mucilaginibacter daejeonensis]|uniref:CotH kinase family protein n=1 Tax=Mucilaginibacter daejeonensis TaxID=398049 RepID=UPI001D17436B|nr:CotH kinase family protein [Mucilaginibacter daejeonensis]UEG52892.1 CotH kinase family protein [Mucilaginibacter daejeonensis]